MTHAPYVGVALSSGKAGAGKDAADDIAVENFALPTSVLQLRCRCVAIVLLPEPDSPVNQITAGCTCFCQSGLRPSRARADKEQRFGSCF